MAEIGPEEINAGYKAPAVERRPFAERHTEVLWITLIAVSSALN
jgi:hypothetical protein